MHLVLFMQRKWVEMVHMMESNQHNLRDIKCGCTLQYAIGSGCTFGMDKHPLLAANKQL